jgi:PII-like signaling protein
MQFKLLLALTDDVRLNKVLDAAREAGATGETVIRGARGEGARPEKTFLGLDLARHRNIVLLVVEEHLSRNILEAVAKAGEFDSKPGSGIAVQIDVEDAIGLASQMKALSKRIGDTI